MSRLDRKSLVATACAALVAGILAVMPANSARATAGDQLVQFDAAITAGAPPCSINTGLAYDGDSLIISCWYNSTLSFVDAVDHTSNGSVTVSGLYGIQAMAYDLGRDRLWVCNGNTVYLVDQRAGMLDASVAPIATSGCIDGLAYDGSDDTLWVSGDSVSTIQHFQTDGTLIETRSLSGLIGGCGNSGIAVGGDQLFLANNGCSQVYQVSKDLTSSSYFAGLNRRVEDMECDDRTFPGVGAMWVQDAYDQVLTAFEMPVGLCSFGGGARSAASTARAARAFAGPLGLDTGDIGYVQSASGSDASSSEQVGVTEASPVLEFRVATTYAASTQDPATATATASVSEVSLADGLITADAITATANASLDDEDVPVLGSEGTRFANLVIGGVPYPAEVDPNTAVSVPGVGTLTLRKESMNETGDRITVDALTLESEDGTTQVIVSTASAAAGTDPANGEPAGAVTPPLPDLPTLLASPAASFDSGFEEGETIEWTTSGSWAIGVPASWRAAHGGERVAATRLDSNYPNGDRAILTSPSIDLSGYDPTDDSPLNGERDTRALLTYFQYFSSEAWYDCGFIQASTDDGATWSLIAPTEGYNFTSNASCGNYYPAQSFSGYDIDAEWNDYTLDLTPFAGEQVQLRFVFGSDGSVTAPGWYLDDFHLEFLPNE